MISFLKNRGNIAIIIIVFSFIFLHLFGVSIPYHQDEYKWPMYGYRIGYEPGSIPHPPLTEFIYTKIAPIFGIDNFRFIPFLFGLANLFLLYYLVKFISNKKTAIFSVFLFTASFYSLLASLTVDTDGAVLPFFFLISVISYLKLKSDNFNIKNNKYWLFLLVVSVVFGFLVKVSFVLSTIALALDFIIEKRIFKDKKQILKYIGFSFLIILGFVAILLISKLIFPFFNLSFSLNYWKHFAVLDRGWLQIFIQFIKAVLYTSPLLLLPLVFTTKEVFQKTRVFFMFIFVGTFFYLFAFDFSLGALDRYFAFLVVPLCVIASFVYIKSFENFDWKSNKNIIFITLAISVVILLLQFTNHFIPALYPKTEWISRVLSFKWNFLYPFMGGSGPIPFYISFLFIALMWTIGGFFSLLGFLKTNIKNTSLITILIIGLFYNAVFIEEYLFGGINGSSRYLVKESVDFIKNNSEIKQVLVYNDNGGWDVRSIGKYARRIYATPQFEESYKEVFSGYRGHILVIDIPKIYKDSLYQKYFDSCDPIYQKTDKKINSTIYDCK